MALWEGGSLSSKARGTLQGGSWLKAGPDSTSFLNRAWLCHWCRTLAPIPFLTCVWTLCPCLHFVSGFPSLLRSSWDPGLPGALPVLAACLGPSLPLSFHPWVCQDRASSPRKRVEHPPPGELVQASVVYLPVSCGPYTEDVHRHSSRWADEHLLKEWVKSRVCAPE